MILAVPGTLEVLDGGAATTVQDGGRFGYRRLGVAVSGALDSVWLACANALAGNAAATAALEMRLAGPRLKVTAGPLRIALVGADDARIERGGEPPLALPAWRSATLEDGDVLRVGLVRAGVGYLAVAGGIDVPLRIGSRSTYLRAQLGGVDGRPLRRDDRIRTGTLAAAAAGHPELAGSSPYAHASGPLRVLLGPQDDHFISTALETLSVGEYAVTRDADRMGIRLEGPALAHRPEKGGEIVSDGVVPGALQVPPSGQPILLCADCQTVGGYPKIAVVIRADLPRLAHLLPGDRARFEIVTREQAVAALHEQVARVAAWIGGMEAARPLHGIDEQALYDQNLISGIVDALS